MRVLNFAAIFLFYNNQAYPTKWDRLHGSNDAIMFFHVIYHIYIQLIISRSFLVVSLIAFLGPTLKIYFDYGVFFTFLSLMICTHF
jgi:hypothetical protein